jgi:hypothetical protein
MTDYCCCLLEASVCYLSSNVFCVMETSKLNEDSAAFESKKVQIEFLDREKIILSSHHARYIFPRIFLPRRRRNIHNIIFKRCLPTFDC